MAHNYSFNSAAAFLGQGENVAHFGLGLRGIDEHIYRIRVQIGYIKSLLFK